MSLINDALKKAQRQRDEGTTPPTEDTAQNTAPEQLQRVARRAKPAGFRSQLMLIGGGAAAAVVLLGVGAVFFLRSGEQPAPSPATPTPVASAPAQAVASPAAQIAPAPAPATPTALTVALPPTQSPAPEPTPAQVAVAAPAPVAPAPLQPATGQFVLPAPPATEPAQISDSSATTAPAPTVVERPKPSTRMIGVIERYRVGGIRVAGAESKVLMNDKVYRTNDIVDHELGIRLTAIEPKALTFEDSRGAVHTRTF